MSQLIAQYRSVHFDTVVYGYEH